MSLLHNLKRDDHISYRKTYMFVCTQQFMCLNCINKATSIKVKLLFIGVNQFMTLKIEKDKNEIFDISEKPKPDIFA